MVFFSVLKKLKMYNAFEVQVFKLYLKKINVSMLIRTEYKLFHLSSLSVASNYTSKLRSDTNSFRDARRGTIETQQYMLHSIIFGS